MNEKIVSIIIGYIFGSFLTAEIVAKKVAGKSAGQIGDSGNPGMANIMASLGFVPGIITLAGDLGKCIAAGLISYGLFRESGWIITFYAGFGCTLGHDFPFWRKFRGGKGVAASSMAVVLYQFFPGVAANIIGMLVVFITKYLCLGGPAIPLSFTILMLVRKDREAAVIALLMTVLSFQRHGSSMLGIKGGKTKQTDVLGAIRRKLKH